jgi:hypothetical protein
LIEEERERNCSGKVEEEREDKGEERRVNK